MTEKTDLKTDDQVGFKTQLIGTDPITGLKKYRRFKSLNSDTHIKQHVISYEEWLVAKDGKVYDEFYKIKNYLNVDITDTGSEYPAYTKWFEQLEPVLAPAIDSTLLAIPIDTENNYVVNK